MAGEHRSLRRRAAPSGEKPSDPGGSVGDACELLLPLGDGLQHLRNFRPGEKSPGSVFQSCLPDGCFLGEGWLERFVSLEVEVRKKWPWFSWQEQLADVGRLRWMLLAFSSGIYLGYGG